MIGAGSSYARGPDKEKVVKDVSRIVKADWGKMYDLKSSPIEVSLWDVSGNDHVWWDNQGVHGDEPTQWLENRKVQLK